MNVTMVQKVVNYVGVVIRKVYKDALHSQVVYLLKFLFLKLGVVLYNYSVVGCGGM